MQVLITLGDTQSTTPFIILFDINKSEIVKRWNYKNNIITQKHSESFRGGQIFGKKFYTCTHCEIVSLDFKKNIFKSIISHNSFNDLHDVFVDNNGIYVVNTGHDLIQKFSYQNKLLCEYSLKDTHDGHYLKDKDYRYDTKLRGSNPDRSHPNHITFIEGNLFVTECKKKRFTNIITKEIAIQSLYGMAHEGILFDNKIYFTITNGMLDIYSLPFFQRETTVDLSQYYDTCKGIGWCRGLCVNEDRIIIGFTKFRSSNRKGFFEWINYKKDKMASHLLILDKNFNFIKKYNLDDLLGLNHSHAIIYGIYEVKRDLL